MNIIILINALLTGIVISCCMITYRSNKNKKDKTENGITLHLDTDWIYFLARTLDNHIEYLGKVIECKEGVSKKGRRTAKNVLQDALDTRKLLNNSIKGENNKVELTLSDAEAVTFIFVIMTICAFQEKDLRKAANKEK